MERKAREERDPNYELQNGENVSKYGSLIFNNSYYWLASVDPAYTYDLWYVHAHGGYVNSSSGYAFGVRPKVSLISGIQTTGRNTSGAWEMKLS